MTHKNQSVDAHRFAMTPKAEIPRSSFLIEHTHKTTIDAGYLIPIYVDEVLPGDHFNLRATIFARLATPIFPVMDNLHLETFFFFVPTRLLWSNWVKMMGEQLFPGDSISFIQPTVTSPVGGFAPLSIFDYMGLPCTGQVAGGNTVTVTSLPLRAYLQIYNQWFRDENLANSFPANVGDGPDASTLFGLVRRGKRHDYFTSCLPWPQKGGTAVTIPLGTSAPVRASGSVPLIRGGGGAMTGINLAAAGAGTPLSITTGSTIGAVDFGPAGTATTGLVADLSTATAATINALRQSFQIQRLLERDARGGTRYIESILSHFGVRSPDARLDRPEYLGGGRSPIIINPIAQTSATGLTGGTTPAGQLAAMGTSLANGHGFNQSFTEHGYILGLVNVRADLTYQQGIRKMWSRSTRYDHYYPVFAHLGEQTVLNREIYADGSANDALAFGYQERWAEYRYHPSRISGLFRSTTAGTIDPWHLAQRFTVLPTLNQTFIEETPPLSRVLAVGAGAAGQQLIVDSFFSARVARPMPLYSVPGQIDRF